MSEFASIVIVSLVGYLLGAISFAVLVARSHGVDIFKEGSGNPGATNVKRAVGKKAGNLVFALDALKGFIASFWPQFFFAGESLFAWEVPLGVWGLIAAIIGHSFSIFIQFRGGKGVATAMGGLLALVPWVLVGGIVVWVMLFYSFRYVSLASIGFGISLPLTGYLLGRSQGVLMFLGLLATLVVVRHRSNIQRLMSGTENKFVKK